MKKAKFKEELITYVLWSAEAAMPMVEICRKMAVIEQGEVAG